MARPSFLHEVLSKFRFTFEGFIIAFAAGIAIYFAWPTEPWRIFALLAPFSVAALWFAMRDVPPPWSEVVGLSLAILFGFSVAALRTHMLNPNPVEREIRASVTGWVSDVDTRRNPPRYRIETIDASLNEAPKALRIRIGRTQGAPEIGDIIRVEAVLSPLPGPAVPSGYDPGRRAFFDGLAASGFSIAEVQPVEARLSRSHRWRRAVLMTRHRIAGRVLDAAPVETAGLQAALITGIRTHIPEEQTEALRASGLAHILAISGLHMGLVALTAFSLISFLLAQIGRWARRYDMRKPAAIIAVIVAVGYLLLSGASVATQRAFIMAAVMFAAVLLDRKAISLRSVAVAALLTLLIRPEALLSVGFQMSFAAVTALVVVYNAVNARRRTDRFQTVWGRACDYVASLTLTSFIAGMATGGFALFHFGRVAHYGLFANVLAMWLFPLVMALGLSALLVMPLGLETRPLQVMGIFIGWMVWIADWVSGWHGAVGHVSAGSGLVLALYAAGFTAVCLLPKQRWWVGVAAIAAAIALWMAQPSDDLRIDEKGRVTLWGDGSLVTDNLRADRYGGEQFARQRGEARADVKRMQDDFAACDDLACRFQLKGRWISVIQEPSEVPEACADSDLVILSDRPAGPVARRECEAVLVDAKTRPAEGALHIRLGRTITLHPAVPKARRNRPWG